MKISDFKLERFFAEHEFTVRHVLCASDCETFAVSELLALGEDSEKEFHKLRLGYTESPGSLVLRQEISKLYSMIGPDDILVFAGAEEGIFIFMNVLLNKGDHVIVQYPAYQSLFEVASALGCEVTRWEMKERDAWRLDLNTLEYSIKRNTKAIVVNLPHNPTGYLASLEEFQKIIAVARKHNLYVFSDEVYRFLEYSEGDRLPAACDLYDKGVSLGAMSKSFGLAGLRIGWIATKDRELLRQIGSFKDYTTICNSAPDEFLSTLVLRHKEHLLRRNVGIIKNNLTLLNEFFDRYRNLFEWFRPKAGPIAFPKITFNRNIEEFIKDLIVRKGVLLLPSTLYDFGDKHFRIGFGRKNMEEALEKLEEYVKENV